jgi:sialate O-acetylesterase
MKKTLVVLVTLGLIGLAARAQNAPTTALRLPEIIGDHMVLQAGQPDPIWGWAPAGTAVKIDFNDGSGKNLAHADTTADADGKWSAKLPALTAGTAGQLVVTAGSDSRTIQDVLVGENWLCSGQSNMEGTIGSPRNSPQNIATSKQEAMAANGAIRFFYTLRYGNQKPQDDVKGFWEVANANSVGACSNVAWNFAVPLHDKLGHPVGLIISAVGGSSAETWTPQWALDPLSVYPEIKKRVDEDEAELPGSLDKFDQETTAFFQAHTPQQIAAMYGEKRPRGEPLPGSPKIPAHPGVLHVPSYFYNGMIQGLVPYGISGVIWYQADANSSFPTEYPELIKALVNAWRKNWGTELPFYYVEVQNMMAFQTAPVEDLPKRPHPFTAALRWECATVLDLPKTDVATAIDLSLGPDSATNPHFENKKPLGLRLANLALAQVYGQNLGEVHGPTYAGYKIEGNTIRITLTHAAGLKPIKGEPLTGFAIRGDGGPWVWGDAKIDGTDIVVSSSQVPNPTAVRYAWAANPIKNLSVQNEAGLPLRPFRTDNDPLPDHLPEKMQKHGAAAETQEPM